MAHTIVRIEHNDRSVSINISDIGYLDFSRTNDQAILTIILTIYEGCSIIIEDFIEENFDKLEEIYHDLYTKWKIREEENRELENVVYSLQ